MNIVKNFNLCCLFLKSIIAIKKIINIVMNNKKRQIGGQIIKKKEEKHKKYKREKYNRYIIRIKMFPNRDDVQLSLK